MNKYIKKVEWCNARHLYLAVPLTDNIHVYCVDYMPYEELPVVGLASLEVSDAVDNGVRLWTSKLTATLPERPAVPDTAVSLRLTAVDGTVFLMGLDCRPHPVVTIDDRHPSNASGLCACSFQALLKGSMPALVLCS